MMVSACGMRSIQVTAGSCEAGCDRCNHTNRGEAEMDGAKGNLAILVAMIRRGRTDTRSLCWRGETDPSNLTP